MQALHDHILNALQTWALVTKDRSASNSSFCFCLRIGIRAKEKKTWFSDPTLILNQHSSLASWCATPSTTLLPCSTWYAMQSSNFFPLTLPLYASPKLEGLCCMLTCQFKYHISSNVPP